MPHRWLILGSGGHGRSVADAIRAQGDAVLGFLDDTRPADELVAGIPVLGPLRLAWDVTTQPCPEGAPSPDRFVVAIGNPVLRQRWQHVLEGTGAPVGVVVHPRACVSPSAQLAPGCVVSTPPWPAGHASGRWLPLQQARCSAAVSIALPSWRWQRELPISVKA